MNVHDVIDLKKQEDVKELISPIKTRCMELERFLNYANPIIGMRASTKGEIAYITEREVDAINASRKAILLEHGSLGDLETKPLSPDKLDIWGRLSRTPKSDLSSLRSLCDALGFIIIPFEYLDDRSYVNEHYKIQSSIHVFSSQTSAHGFQPYVLCPVVHYSLDKHVRSKNPDLPIYAGRHSQAFIAAQMTIPSLRTIIVDLEAVKSQISNFDARMSSAEKNLQMMVRLLNDLQSQVEVQQREIALQQAKQKALQAKLAELEASRFTALEPIMFSVDKKADINKSNTIAYIGPCWGPDFEDIVFTAIGLAKRAGQREQVIKTIGHVWP